MARELSTLLEIDFLPSAYRERSMHRRAYVWRVAAAVAIAAFFAAASLWQHNHHARVEARLAAVAGKFSDAAHKTAELAQVSAGLAAKEKTANLLTYLRHRWPRTRVLAAVVEPLPETVLLTECHIGYETRQTSRASAVVLPEGDTVPAEKAERRANDLKRLLLEASRQVHFVAMAGEAEDPAALHEYVARLQINPLFARVELQSLERLTSSADTGGSVRFAVRAVLREGHGRAAPKKPPTTPTPTPASPGEAPLAQRGG